METDGKSSVQVETSQTYASRQTASWRHVRGTRVNSCRPSRRWRPGGDVKRSWNMKDSSERQCQSKDGAGGRTRRVPPAHLDTHTHTHTLHRYYMNGDAMSQLSLRFWTTSMTRAFPAISPLCVSVFNKHKQILEVTRTLPLWCETWDAVLILLWDWC